MATNKENTSNSIGDTSIVSSGKGSYDKVPDSKRQILIRLVYEQGQSIKEAAEILTIKYSTARTIIANYAKHGSINLKKKGGRVRNVLTQNIINSIEMIVSSNPQLTLKEIKKTLEGDCDGDDGFSISTTSINRCLQELKITMKQTHRELDRVNAFENIQLRKKYALWFNNHFNNDFSRAVFIDESSFNLHLKRSCARSRRGTRAIVTVPTVRGRSISLIASMTINGIGYCKTISNSTVNGDIFAEYTEELCKYLRDEVHLKGACLILDNARIHRKSDIEKITTQFNFEFKFLSPYSYMLNPIENAFSKIKNGIRSKLRLGATGLFSELMMSETNSITAADSAGYFRYILRNITNCAAELPYTHK